MPNPTAAMLVIGDEILSGRTHDSNTHYLAGQLTQAGIDLCEARVVSDAPQAIIDAVQSLSATYDHVFTSGGIGPTHDDITADCIAQAFDRPIGIRADARKILQNHYDTQGLELNDARLRMARIPEGADLIDNPVSKAPGFILGNVHVMAGVPKIFQAMVASVLPSLTGGAPMQSESWRVEMGEGMIAAPLGKIAETHPDVSVGCYPFQKDGLYGANIIVRSQNKEALEAALTDVQKAFPK